MTTQDQRQQEALLATLNALRVIIKTPATRAYLADRDPQAVIQALDAQEQALDALRSDETIASEMGYSSVRAALQALADHEDAL